VVVYERSQNHKAQAVLAARPNLAI